MTEHPTLNNTRLYAAVAALVTGNSNLKKRLCTACEILQPIRANVELSKALALRLQKLIEEASSKGPETNPNGQVTRGSFEMTLKNKHIKTCEKLAKEILHIYLLDNQEKDRR